jgi:hypothetical protein
MIPLIRNAERSWPQVRQAIVTKYLGPTNFRGSRVVAKAYAGRVVIPWDDALGQDENHEMAARALCLKFGWFGRLVGGGLPDNRGNAYVLLPDAPPGEPSRSTMTYGVTP